jgi:hypothetical protein
MLPAYALQGSSRATALDKQQAGSTNLWVE